MRIPFVRSWKAVALRGTAGVAFGVAILFWFDASLPGLAILFGAYSLVDGAMTVLAGGRPQAPDTGWILEGILAMAFGMMALSSLEMTLPALVDLFAVWAILTGFLELVAAVRTQGEVPGELSLGSAGGASLLLGIAMLVWPEASALAFVALLGCYALCFGTSMMVLAVQLQRSASRFDMVRASALRVLPGGRA